MINLYNVLENLRKEFPHIYYDFESPKDIFEYLKIDLETLLLISSNMPFTLNLDQRKNTGVISIT